MQENQTPEVNQVPVTPVVDNSQVTTTQVSDQQPLPVQSTKTNNFLVGLLSVLLLLSVSIAGFFAYQTQNLVKELTLLRAVPTPTPEAMVEATASPTTTFILGWEDFSIPLIGLNFQYPNNLSVTTDIVNSTTLKADEQYWVAVEGSDIIYLDTYLYKSANSPMDWWNMEGKSKFDRLGQEIEDVMNPKPEINLTYEVTQSILAGKESLNIVVSSNYGSPHTPTKRYLTIVQVNGYIMMVSYNDQGTTEPSIDISKKILSTFKFTN